jgi:hypothetical protein
MILGTVCAMLALGQGGDLIVARVLPNGASYRVESTPGTGRVVVALHASAENLPGDGGVSGTRHLLEHLLAKGSDGKLDIRLESAGLSLTASTDRDGIGFVILGSSDQAVLAVESLREFFAPLGAKDEDVAKELEIIRQEMILASDFAPFFDSAWRNLFDPGVDSAMGDLKLMAGLRSADLRGSAAAAMAAGGLTVFVKGDVDAKVVGLRLAEVLGRAGSGKPTYEPRLFVESIGKRDSVDGKGSARAVVSAGLDRPMTLARVGVALALQRLEPGLQVVYEPSFDRGPILLYAKDSPFIKGVNNYAFEDVARIAPLVRLKAVQYANGLLREGAGYGLLRAKGMRQSAAFKLETLRDTAAGLTNTEIWAALQDWKGTSMQIEGLR